MAYGIDDGDASERPGRYLVDRGPARCSAVDEYPTFDQALKAYLEGGVGARLWRDDGGAGEDGEHLEGLSAAELAALSCMQRGDDR